MDSEQIHRDLNGFGRRLTEVEKMESRVSRNESDIQKVFDELAKIPEQNQKLLTTILFAAVISIGTATWAIVTK